MRRLATLCIAPIAVVALSPACIRQHAPVDLTDFDQVRQVAIDHGLVCGPTLQSHGTTRAGCTLGETNIGLTMGEGYDGLAFLQEVLAERDAVNPACPIYELGISHGQVWAGDGYYISLYNAGPSNELELALTDALGVDPACERRGPLDPRELLGRAPPSEPDSNDPQNRR